MLLELSDFRLVGSTRDAPAPPADGWLAAMVPGGVHESLVAAGLIGHPYFSDNESSVRWVEDTVWWYRATFSLDELPEASAVLRFACLDTLAELWLNGQPLGEVRNQHRPHELDVLGLLRDDNTLLVRFPPPLEALLTAEEESAAERASIERRERIRPGAPEQPRDELLLPARRSRLRKSTFSWGWDFAARVPSLGIAGPVTLLLDEPAPPAHVHVWTSALDVAAATATLSVQVGGADGLAVAVTAPDGVRTEASGPGDLLAIELMGVDPWWTHDLGAQSLYDVEVTVAGRTTRLRTGIRTIELDRSPAAEGTRHFRFLLNGQPLFARGANWVPASLLTGSVPHATSTGLVELARAGGMNMIRMWGGGVYEPDVVYDRCDELGVLVWQDFMFACADYPDPTGELAAETELEARHQVLRLRNHPCIALWCGNNEVQAIHELAGGDLETDGWGASLFHELLPAVTSELSPDIPYWPSSPWGEATTEIVNGWTDGDRHAWEVWHGIEIGAGGPTEFASRGEAVHFERYRHDRGRFISEFGIHAAPELATLQRWSPPGSLDLGSPALLHRIKDTPKDKGFALIEHETGLPQTLEQYVDFSMACQAEGLKLGVEHYRRRQPECSGTLVWQLNDSWPGLSWSVIDYDLVPKAGYYFLQRAYAPVMASFRLDQGVLELWVTSSAPDPVDLDLEIDLAEFDGPVRRETASLRAEPYSSQVVWSTGALPSGYAWVGGAGIPANRAFFGRLKELPLGAGRLTSTITRTSATTATVDLTADSYVYLARVTSSHAGARFSDNYLDLRPGDTRPVEVTGLCAEAVLSVGCYAGKQGPGGEHSA